MGNLHAKVGDMIHPVSAMLHYKVATEVKRFSPSSVVDIGGVGKMSKFIQCKMVDVNKNNGVDGTNLPYGNNAFDVSVSVATLEHVDDQKKFMEESIRVAKKASVHWFPCGEWAQITEDYKKPIPKYNHPCVLPDIESIIGMGYQSYDYVTVAEHMLLLCSLYGTINCMKTYNFIAEYGNKPYGKLVIIDKLGE